MQTVARHFLGLLDADTVVHIGADEFMADAKSYREFVNEIIPYVDKTNTVRMWGGLTQIKDNPPTEINKDAIDGVQINLWSKDWAAKGRNRIVERAA